jgi:hypothetical protein
MDDTKHTLRRFLAIQHPTWSSHFAVCYVDLNMEMFHLCNENVI